MRVDHVLSYGKGFPKLEVALEKYMRESPEVQRIYSEYAQYFTLWSETSGSSIATIGDVNFLYRTLTIEKKRGLK